MARLPHCEMQGRLTRDLLAIMLMSHSDIRQRTYLPLIYKYYLYLSRQHIK